MWDIPLATTFGASHPATVNRADIVWPVARPSPRRPGNQKSSASARCPPVAWAASPAWKAASEAPPFASIERGDVRFFQEIDMIRVREILVLAGLLLGGVAQACSCAGTLSFAETVKHADLVLEGRVARVEVDLRAPAEEIEVEMIVDGKTVTRRVSKMSLYATRGLAFEVTRTLKGQAPTLVHVADQMMCYTSISPREMQKGASYVIALFPLGERMIPPWQEKKPAVPIFVTALCAETALLREGDKLYTFERATTPPYAPQKKFYANYQDFINTLPPAPPTQKKPSP
jgi:hypothetical protein